MSIQQDVLDCIGPNGIGAKELRGRLGNVPQGELDVCTNALMRNGKIALMFGRFELGGAKRTTVAPPTAAQEAAASLRPDSKVCKSCRVPKPLCEFRTTSAANDRADECNTCHGKRTKAGQLKASAIHVTAPVVARHQSVATVESRPEAPKQPVISDHVIQRVTAECSKATEEIARQERLIVELEQEIGVRRVEITHQRELRDERESFLALYAKFAEGLVS